MVTGTRWLSKPNIHQVLYRKSLLIFDLYYLVAGGETYSIGFLWLCLLKIIKMFNAITVYTQTLMCLYIFCTCYIFFSTFKITLSWNFYLSESAPITETGMWKQFISELSHSLKAICLVGILLTVVMMLLF